MIFDSGTKTEITVDMVLDFDPTGTTIEVQVDATWYAATWQGTAAFGTPVQGRPTWQQAAQTTGLFAGPDVASPGAAVVLQLGTHPMQTRVTSGQRIIADDCTPCVVRTKT